jgi:hypothetical protein
MRGAPVQPDMRVVFCTHPLGSSCKLQMACILSDPRRQPLLRVAQGGATSPLLRGELAEQNTNREAICVCQIGVRESQGGATLRHPGRRKIVRSRARTCCHERSWRRRSACRRKGGHGRGRDSFQAWLASARPARAWRPGSHHAGRPAPVRTPAAGSLGIAERRLPALQQGAEHIGLTIGHSGCSIERSGRR